MAVTAPTAASTIAVGSAVSVTATATATTAGTTISGVQFFANGVAVGALDTAFPYAATWQLVLTARYGFREVVFTADVKVV